MVNERTKKGKEATSCVTSGSCSSMCDHMEQPRGPWKNIRPATAKGGGQSGAEERGATCRRLHPVTCRFIRLHLPLLGPAVVNNNNPLVNDLISQ